MNTPNKLTVLRVVFVPFFIAFLFLNGIPFNYLWATLVFIAASVTDWLDGYLARKNDMITTFGKFLDPLADKVLVISALICFISLDLCSPVAVIIIIAREFLVTSVRLAAVDGGKVISASLWGKLKTAFTMIAIITILVMQIFVTQNMFDAFFCGFIGEVLIWIATIVTVVSGIEYLVKNKEFINTKE